MYNMHVRIKNDFVRGFMKGDEQPFPWDQIRKLLILWNEIGIVKMPKLLFVNVIQQGNHYLTDG